MAHHNSPDEARAAEHHVAAAATAPGFELAEGVIWDDAAALVRWVDIWAGDVWSAALEGDALAGVTAVSIGQTAGAVALAEDGGLLVAGARGLVTIAPGGAVSGGPDLLGDRTEVRFNDGSIDPQGRFVVGTLALGEPTGTETLLRVSANGDVETVRRGIRLSNGVAFSPDGATIYHVDTLAGTVSSHSYSPGPFDRDEPWVTVIDDFPHFPDGLIVDSEGMLWVAQWGGGRVLRYSPGGELAASVTVDAAQASCMGFVGPKLDRLAITTATEGLTEVTDLGGSLFLADVGASGLPTPRWPGSTTRPYWVTG